MVQINSRLHFENYKVVIIIIIILEKTLFILFYIFIYLLNIFSLANCKGTSAHFKKERDIKKTKKKKVLNKNEFTIKVF